MTDLQLSLRNKEYNSTLISIKQINDKLAIFKIRPDSLIENILGGQYVTLGLFDFEFSDEASDKPKLIRRAYSISKSLVDIDEDGILEFYVALVDNGALTTRLFQLKLNDRVYMSNKALGHYQLPNLDEKNSIVFASTGTGLAPHLTMLKEAIATCRKVVLIDCVRLLIDQGYREELENFEKKYDNFSYIPLATRDDEIKCYIQDYFTNDILDRDFNLKIDEYTHVYCCGNPKMIGIPKKDRETGEYTYAHEGGVVEVLMNKYDLKIHRTKVPGNIHFEKYW